VDRMTTHYWIWLLRREGVPGLALLAFISLLCGAIWWYSQPIDHTGYEQTTARLISVETSISRRGPSRVILTAQTVDGLFVTKGIPPNEAKACKVGATVRAERKNLSVYLLEDPCRHP
jgi:hypothetical protein